MEERVWFKIAERTGCSVVRAMNETTVSQFYKWKFLFEEENAGRTDNLLLWHLAQIAREVACVPSRVWGKNPMIETKEFLMKLYEPSVRDEKPSPEALKLRQAVSRSVWGAAAAQSAGTVAAPLPLSNTMTSMG